MIKVFYENIFNIFNKLFNLDDTETKLLLLIGYIGIFTLVLGILMIYSRWLGMWITGLCFILSILFLQSDSLIKELLEFHLNNKFSNDLIMACRYLGSLVLFLFGLLSLAYSQNYNEIYNFHNKHIISFINKVKGK